MYRRKREVEHFQTNYLKDFHKYLDGPKQNMDKRKRKKNSRAKKQKYKRFKNVERKNFTTEPYGLG